MPLSVVRDDIVFPAPEFHKRETTLLASGNALPGDLATVVDATRAGRVPAAALNTRRAALADAARRFPAWRRPGAGVIKAVVEV